MAECALCWQKSIAVLLLPALLGPRSTADPLRSPRARLEAMADGSVFEQGMRDTGEPVALPVAEEPESHPTQNGPTMHRERSRRAPRALASAAAGTPPPPAPAATEDKQTDEEPCMKRTKTEQCLKLPSASRALTTRVRGLTRDSAHWCYFCQHVFWTGPATEGYERNGPSFCTLCGSKLLPGARDAGFYSRLAEMPDEDILTLMEKEATSVGSTALGKFSHPGVGIQHLRSQIKHKQDALSAASSLRRASNSKFCDICGHGGVHIHCGRCPTSFHRTCIVLPPDYPLPKEGWWCSGCMHEAIRVGEIAPLPLEPRLNKRTLPGVAQHCSSCGYPEIESLNCDACFRWFCFACMCVSQECVPSGEWACPECVGQQAYDEKLSGQIRVSRERWLAGKMNAKERDGFSQLVFDLYCSCNWSEWKINVDALISDNKMRLERDPSYLPTMLPFQSLHYPLEKSDMKRIAQAYAKTTEVKVYRAYRMAESRIRGAEEEEEQRRKGEDKCRSWAPGEKGVVSGGDGEVVGLPSVSSEDQLDARRTPIGMKEGNYGVAVTNSNGETVKEKWHLNGAAGDFADGEDGMPGVCVERAAMTESDASVPPGVLKAVSESAQGSASASEISMWRPEMCQRGVRGRDAAGRGKQRLRIGYMSSDFVNHPTADLIIRALLLHNSEEFETFCYSLAKDDNSSYRRVLEKEIRNFRLMPKGLSDRKCAEMIAEDGIHILVNLNGHTAGDRNGISALRPAPLQVVYLAYPGTMGARYIDYNVVDHHVCPHEHREFYTEKLLYMPHSYQANSFNDLYKQILSADKLPKRADYQLPEDAFVLCNFCRLGRITEELFSVWMRILQKVPHSILWLYKHPRAAMYRLQEAARAVDPSLVSRIIFASPCSPKLEHLRRVTLADLCLDTTVYNGHTTGSDMLWAGVPMITVLGDNWPSRVASCLALCVDMPQMVMKDLQEYEDTAVRLALHPAELAEWRLTLAHKRLSAPLFDTERWVRSFEDGLQQMWDQWVNGNLQRQALLDIECQDFGQSPSCLQKLFEFETYGALLDAQPDSNHWVASSNPHGYAFGGVPADTLPGS